MRWSAVRSAAHVVDNEAMSSKFPKTTAGAQVSDIDLDQEAVYVNGERLTEERAEQMAAESVRLARAREERQADDHTDA